MEPDIRHELVEFLNEHEADRPSRRPHRLPPEFYACDAWCFFWTLCARRGGQPFSNDQLARAIVDSLLWRRDRHGWKLFCYCLMPDHLHFVVRPTAQSALIANAGARGLLPQGMMEQVGEFKRYTTTQVWWKQSGTGPLWQRSSYDRILWRSDAVEDACAYVLNNPVRKRFVEKWDEYPYSAIVDDWRGDV
jgi:putative transposase